MYFLYLSVHYKFLIPVILTFFKDVYQFYIPSYFFFFFSIQTVFRCLCHRVDPGHLLYPVLAYKGCTRSFVYVWQGRGRGQGTGIGLSQDGRYHLYQDYNCCHGLKKGSCKGLELGTPSGLGTVGARNTHIGTAVAGKTVYHTRSTTVPKLCMRHSICSRHNKIHLLCICRYHSNNHRLHPSMWINSRKISQSSPLLLHCTFPLLLSPPANQLSFLRYCAISCIMAETPLLKCFFIIQYRS